MNGTVGITNICKDTHTHKLRCYNIIQYKDGRKSDIPDIYMTIVHFLKNDDLLKYLCNGLSICNVTLW